jgi:hypothetical protein
LPWLPRARNRRCRFRRRGSRRGRPVAAEHNDRAQHGKRTCPSRAKPWPRRTAPPLGIGRAAASMQWATKKPHHGVSSSLNHLAPSRAQPAEMKLLCPGRRTHAHRSACGRSAAGRLSRGPHGEGGLGAGEALLRSWKLSATRLSIITSAGLRVVRPSAGVERQPRCAPFPSTIARSWRGCGSWPFLFTRRTADERLSHVRRLGRLPRADAGLTPTPSSTAPSGWRRPPGVVGLEAVRQARSGFLAQAGDLAVSSTHHTGRLVPRPNSSHKARRSAGARSTKVQRSAALTTPSSRQSRRSGSGSTAPESTSWRRASELVRRNEALARHHHAGLQRGRRRSA